MNLFSTPTPAAAPLPSAASDAAIAARLAGLGDSLERAAERDLRRARRRLPRHVAMGAGLLLVLGVGTAAATGLFTSKQVAAGMPAGAAIFKGRTPVCVAAIDGVSFTCTLDATPVPEVSDFTGVKEVLSVDGRVAGGCEGQDVAGLTWICYIGQAAVDHGIIGPDFLGEPVLGPGRG